MVSAVPVTLLTLLCVFFRFVNGAVGMFRGCIYGV